MKRINPQQLIRCILVGVIIIALVSISNFLAPVLAGVLDFNPYYFLSWGAPALFYEDVDSVGAMVKLEPWRLLGMQLPAFAGIQAQDWKQVATPPEHTPAPTRPIQPITEAVGIYHTHGSEAFVPSSGSSRSSSAEETVIALGQRIESVLQDNGITVEHSKKFHDHDYNQSYTSSQQTVLGMLDEQDYAMLIDIHRDGVGETRDEARSVTTHTIDGQQAGKIMFVISTSHDNWEKNIRIANDLRNLMDSKYPGLCRGILTRSSSNTKYNQHLHPGNILVEIGGHWNTMEEAMLGADLFADVLVEYLGGGWYN